MLRWLALFLIASGIGNFLQNVMIASGVDIWVSRGIGILAVGIVASVGYPLYLKLVGLVQAKQHHT